MIEGKWHVVVDGKLEKLYQSYVKNMSCISGKTRQLKLKSICNVCGIEFFGQLNQPRKFCSHGCRSKFSGLQSHRKWKKSLVSKQAQRRAYDFINGCIRSRRIIPPTKCSYCRMATKLDAHHPNHTKPNEVIWLCRPCHFKLHYGNKDIQGELVVY